MRREPAETVSICSIYGFVYLAIDLFANGDNSYCEHVSAFMRNLAGCSFKIENSRTLDWNLSFRHTTRSSTILRFANSMIAGAERWRQLAQDFGSLGINKNAHPTPIARS